MAEISLRVNVIIPGPSFITRQLACSNHATCGAVISQHFKSHHPPQFVINSRLPGLLPGLVLDMAEQKMKNNTNFQNCQYFTLLSSED